MKNINKHRFIPYHLVVPGRPEFSLFPLNILFTSFARMNGVLKIYSALYEPLIERFADTGDKMWMPYQNIYDRDPASVWRIVVTLHKNEKIYTGVKCVNDKIMSLSEGDDWNNFFTCWTAHGLSDGESCYFRPVDD